MSSLRLGFSYGHLNKIFPVLPWLKNMYIPIKTFVYEPLKRGQIRLVHVVAYSDTRVECELRHFDLESAQNWAALSYVWGDGPANHKILLNGKLFYVRTNLLGALKAFDLCRHQIREKQWIWIDALCLNQDDAVEKSEQVPQMHRIYSQATIVIIWLGDDKVCPRMIVEAFRNLWFVDSLQRENDSQRAHSWLLDRLKSLALLERCFGITCSQLHAFQKLYDHMSAACNHDFTKLELEIANPAWANFAYKDDLFSPDHPFWGALLAFTSNQWHTRVWTLQEIWLAQNKALLSSQGLIPWDFIYKYLRILVFPGCRFRYMSVMHMYEMQCWTNAADDFYSIIKQNVYTSMEYPGSLAWLLSESHNRKATLAKDHVYALFGLFTDEVKSKITIEYGESDAKVFANVFKLAIGPSVGDASALARLWRTCNSKMPKTEDGWPSWCPDFGDAQVPGYSSPVPYPGEVDDDTVATWRRFAKVDTEQGQDALGFSAARLDIVKRCIPRAMIRSHERQLRDWATSPIHANDLQDLFDLCFDVEMRDWVRGLKMVFPGPNGDIASHVVKFIHSSCVHENQNLGLDVETALSLFCAIETKSIHSMSEVERIFDLSDQAILGLLAVLFATASVQERKFVFETESGKLGIAWCHLSPDDMIIYVPGGSCQFAISQDGRRFLSACYVEGYAGDSLMSILPKDEKDWEIFYVF